MKSVLIFDKYIFTLFQRISTHVLLSCSHYVHINCFGFCKNKKSWRTGIVIKNENNS